jgi:uncharacterized protein (TIGR03083 family)
MPEADALITGLRNSHDRFTALVADLDTAAMQGPSYDDDWSIAQVASHLGSQAEIFGLVLEAGLSGQDAPAGPRFQAIWDVWNARDAADQVAESVAANEAFLARVEQLPEADRDRFAIDMFGRKLDLAGAITMRLAEHAVHTWDVAVALDPAAVVAPDAVELLLEEVVGGTAARSGKAEAEPRTLVVETIEPSRTFTLTTGPAVSLVLAEESESEAENAGQLRLPAEALLRLVYGRLDEAHTPDGVTGADLLPALRAVFPGF